MSGKVVLITGATGLLGPYLVDAARRLGPVFRAARKNAEVVLDVTDQSAVEKVMNRIHPDIVFHAAALTNVDACERDPAAAYLLNRDATGFIVRFLSRYSKMVYISTDQVYPDTKGPHAEGTEAPVNVYGKSKLQGEMKALSHPNTLVFRTNIFGRSRTHGRSSLSDFVIDSLSQGMPIRLFEDIFFSPLHMKTACRLMVEALELGLSGVYNLGCRNGMSKKDFALRVADHKGLSTRGAMVVKSSDIPGRAPRPMDMRLDVSLLERTMGCKMPTLEEEIKLL